MIGLISLFDFKVLTLLYSVRTLHATYLFIGFTEMGSVVTVLGLTACITIWLAYKKYYPEIVGLLFAVAGSGMTTFLLKQVIHRARPNEFFQAYAESGFSFPSGHATDSAALYGYCCFLVFGLLPHQYHRAGAIFFWFLILAVAFSRLYLGVHFLSDVLGGIAVGALFTYLGIRAVAIVERQLKNGRAIF